MKLFIVFILILIIFYFIFICVPTKMYLLSLFYCKKGKHALEDHYYDKNSYYCGICGGEIPKKKNLNNN
ncbi:hypothetical protein COA01_15500 [Bacillus cereus]|nr:hypothetical protein COA01_15500 [Bacillus cereus]